MICSKHYYHGATRESMAALESASQATLTAIYSAAVALHGRGDEVVRGHATTFTFSTVDGWDRMVVRDEAGWWAVVEWRTYDGRGEFRVHAEHGAMPKRLGKLWTDRNFVGKADLAWQAVMGERGWSCPCHAIDFQHPLLLVLELAMGGGE